MIRWSALGGYETEFCSLALAYQSYYFILPKAVQKVPGGQGVGFGGVVVSWLKPIELSCLRLSQTEQNLRLLEKKGQI